MTVAPWLSKRSLRGPAHRRQRRILTQKIPAEAAQLQSLLREPLGSREDVEDSTRELLADGKQLTGHELRKVIHIWHTVIYNRRQGRIVRSGHYSAAGTALDARFKAEREFREDPDIEIVVLGADSMESLQETHSRYFKPVQELAEAALVREARI